MDFTSARFLGPGGPRAPVAAPTLGKPAVLAEPPGAVPLATHVACAQGAERGLVARSTLHALCDVLAVTAVGAPVLVDEHCYPITRWAAGAMHKEGRMVSYHHHDAGHVRCLLQQSQRPATVLTDAWCMGCLSAAPLTGLAEAACAFGARLVVDDSLAFGVLGPGGMGTPAWLGVEHSRLLWVASAGKAFGTPVAVITGPVPTLERIRTDGPQRTHSSPPSTGDIAVLSAALRDPLLPGRRRRLARRTHYFRSRLAALGVATLGAPLPVVGVPLPGVPADVAVARLRSQGIEALLTRSACRRQPLTTCCVRGDHTERDLDAAAAALAAIARTAA